MPAYLWELDIISLPPSTQPLPIMIIPPCPRTHVLCACFLWAQGGLFDYLFKALRTMLNIIHSCPSLLLVNIWILFVIYKAIGAEAELQIPTS